MAINTLMPWRTEGQGLRLVITGRGTDPEIAVLQFGSEQHMKQWLLQTTIAVLGKRKAELVTGEQLEDHGHE